MSTNGNRRIKAVFFDLYNTLARFWPPREQIQAQACADFGYTVTPEGIARGYLRADAFMSSENARSQVQRRTPADQLAFFTEYERLILESAGFDAPPSVAGSIWQSAFASSPTASPSSTTSPTCCQGCAPRATSPASSPTWHPPARRSRATSASSPYADFVVTSGEVGQGKPHAPIYLTAPRPRQRLPVRGHPRRRLRLRRRRGRHGRRHNPHLHQPLPEHPPRKPAPRKASQPSTPSQK